jgi:hypothetical protein
VRADLVVSERGSVLALHALYAERLAGRMDRVEIVLAIGSTDRGGLIVCAWLNEAPVARLGSTPRPSQVRIAKLRVMSGSTSMPSAKSYAQILVTA